MKHKEYQDEWSRIDSLANEGLVKSALEALDKLKEKVEESRDTLQTIKILIYYNKFQTQLEEDSYENALNRFEAALNSYTGPQKAIVHSQLAELYAGYLQSRIYQIRSRTEVLHSDDNDVRNWDVARLIRQINMHYMASLDPATREATVDDYNLLLTDKQWADTLRPTLYDLLAHRAIDYFSRDYAYLVEPVYAFQADQPVLLGTAKDFVEHRFSTPDTSSYLYKTVRLFQELLAFRLSDNNTSALVDADLKRLRFFYEKEDIASKDTLYLDGLRRLQQQAEGTAQEDELLYYRAEYLYRKGQAYSAGQPGSETHRWTLKEAGELIIENIPDTSDSYGAQQCKALLTQIRQKSLNIQFEEVNLPGAPLLGYVQYRNVGQLNFRIVRLSQDVDDRHAYRNQKEREEYYLSLPAVREWSVDLPDEGDYQTHAVEFPIEPLETGRYALLATDSVFNGENTTLTHQVFHVSGLAFFQSKTYSDQGKFIIVDRQSGKPLTGVRAEFYSSEYAPALRRQQWHLRGRDVSDQDGAVSIDKGSRERNLHLRLIRETDTLFLGENFSQYVYDVKSRVTRRVFFFLDRAIYRPGQTVYFKGYLMEFDRDGLPSIIPDQKVQVSLHDVNGKQRESDVFTCNSYGTFSGSFIAPESGLRGTMSLRSDVGQGSTSFRVEEYKRPRFEVTIDTPSTAVRLGAEVGITGEAKAYAGASISNATFTYRVVRKVYYPYFPWWRSWFPRDENRREIAHGTGKTDDEGKFSFNFQALADESVNPSDNPAFNFEINVDVTDITGETRSGTYRLRLTYDAFRADVELGELTQFSSLQSLPVAMLSQSGADIEGSLTVVVTRLIGPKQPQRERYWTMPDYQFITNDEFGKSFPQYALPDRALISQWPEAEVVGNNEFRINGKTDIDLGSVIRTQGSYKLSLSFVHDSDTVDRTIYTTVMTSDGDLPSHILYRSHVEADTYEPGQTAAVIQQVSDNELSVYHVFDRNGQLTERWGQPNKNAVLTTEIRESDRGGLYFNDIVFFDNRYYQSQHRINVPWSNKELTIEWMSFRDKLDPGSEEEWQLKISGPDKDPVMAEFLAGMYDASLDAFVNHDWRMSLYPSALSRWSPRVPGFHAIQNQFIKYHWQRGYRGGTGKYYRDLNWFGFHIGGYARYDQEGVMERGVVLDAGKAVPPVAMMNEAAEFSESEADLKSTGDAASEEDIEESREEAPQAFKVRTDLEETAFFFPHIETDREGNLILKFKMKEALTRWKFQGIAHTKELEYALTEKTVVTSKDLMVFPNAPRFFRQGDSLSFPVKVANISDKELAGIMSLQILDAATGEDVSGKFGLTNNTSAFTVSAGGSVARIFDVTIPQNWLMPVKYRAVAKAGAIGDGEENLVPVVTNRILVTETKPITVEAHETASFIFDRLQHLQSTTLTNHSFTVEFTPNPAWYVVQTLPYMMEYPHECSEQLFSRLYANLIGSHIVESLPAIKMAFERWEAEPEKEGLLSKLSQNQDLKSALLEETPWVLEAESEEEQRRRMALLFDMHKMARQAESTVGKLSRMQLSNGGFPWFAGGRDNWYITQYIAEGFGHLDKLGILKGTDIEGLKQMQDQMIRYLDARFVEYYNELVEQYKDKPKSLEDDHLGQLIVHYMYTRSYFPLYVKSPEVVKAWEYFSDQAEKYWTDKSLYIQAMISQAALRDSKRDFAERIGRSIAERSLEDEELGRYWKSTRGMYWYQFPIERQALLIEMFTDLGYETRWIDEMRLWLLRNKQTNRWSNTKATAAAVYAFLLSGSDWLSQEKPVVITVGDQTLTADATQDQAGTGYIKQRWDGEAVTTDLATVTVENPNPHMAWGAMYWQYFEDMDKVVQDTGMALQLRKLISIERMTDGGPVLEPVSHESPIHVGDKIVVRLELEVDRPMEFVHFKDHRASGLEPVDVLSSYKWQGGLGYYQSTGDLSTDFFIDRLPRGHWVLEYSLRAQQAGTFSSGIGTLQCMYAPEFSSHTQGVSIEILPE